MVIEPGTMPYAEGSCYIETGKTRVVCTATVDETVPAWLRGRGLGWISAEYALLPRSSPDRIRREVSAGGPSARTHEIERLIARSLRAAVDLGGLGERTILIDCDVLGADGGTRTASITGAYVALSLALRGLVEERKLATSPELRSVAAVSVGLVDGSPFLDLDAEEDRAASVDMNVVMTGDGRFVEVQGTAEHGPFDDAELQEMLAIARVGIAELSAFQAAALGRFASL